MALQRPTERGDGPLTLIDLIRHSEEHVLLCVLAQKDDALLDAVRRTGLPVKVVFQGEDFEDPQALLAAQTGVPAGGAALIRPDAHLGAALPNADPAGVIAAAHRALAA